MTDEIHASFAAGAHAETTSVPPEPAGAAVRDEHARAAAGTDSSDVGVGASGDGIRGPSGSLGGGERLGPDAAALLRRGLRGLFDLTLRDIEEHEIRQLRAPPAVCLDPDAPEAPLDATLFRKYRRCPLRGFGQR